MEDFGATPQGDDDQQANNSSPQKHKIFFNNVVPRMNFDKQIKAKRNNHLLGSVEVNGGGVPSS